MQLTHGQNKHLAGDGNQLRFAGSAAVVGCPHRRRNNGNRHPGQRPSPSAPIHPTAATPRSCGGVGGPGQARHGLGQHQHGHRRQPHRGDDEQPQAPGQCSSTGQRTFLGIGLRGIMWVHVGCICVGIVMVCVGIV